MTTNNECSKCGISWKTLRECLKLGGGNYDTASWAIHNCERCWQELGYLLTPQVMTLDEFSKLERLPNQRVKIEG